MPLLATRDMLHTDIAPRRHRKIQGTEEMCISTTWAVYMVKQSQEHISANLSRDPYELVYMKVRGDGFVI